MSWIITGTEKYETDPYRSQVSLLLHGDGTNGSTTITDSSPTPKTVTAVGDAQISTAQSKFDGASLAFDAAGAETVNATGLKTSSSGFAFETGDFTVEAWIRISAFTPFATVVGTRTGGVGESFAWSLLVRGDGINGLWFFSNSSYQSTGNVLSLDTWHHVAATRASGTLRLFVDGAQKLSTGNTQNFTTSSLSVGAGYRANGNGVELFNGYIDELRVTKGVARYTSNFTPPTAPFPDI